MWSSWGGSHACARSAMWSAAMRRSPCPTAACSSPAAPRARPAYMTPPPAPMPAPIALTGCEGRTGLGYDPRTHVMISACANGKAAVVDPAAGRVVQLLDIGRGPDSVMIDSARGLAFIPCGRDGELDVIPL